MVFTAAQKAQLMNKIEAARNNSLSVYDSLAKDEGADNGTLNSLNSITGGLNVVLAFIKKLQTEEPQP